MENVIQVRNEYRRQQWTQIIRDCQNSGLSNKLAGADGEIHPPERGLSRPHGTEQDGQCVLQGTQAGGQAGERMDSCGENP